MKIFLPNHQPSVKRKKYIENVVPFSIIKGLANKQKKMKRNEKSI